VVLTGCLLSLESGDNTGAEADLAQAMQLDPKNRSVRDELERLVKARGGGGGDDDDAAADANNGAVAGAGAGAGAGAPVSEEDSRSAHFFAQAAKKREQYAKGLAKEKTKSGKIATQLAGLSMHDLMNEHQAMLASASLGGGGGGAEGKQGE
jgi:hypothetical protein